MQQVFADVCRVPVEDDTLVFDPTSIEVIEIRERQEYPGQRVKLTARLGDARVRVQIDIGFGDAVIPDAQHIQYPTLLSFSAPRLLACPKETVVAEKLETMVAFGMINSRMKDYYDIYVISKLFSYDGAVLVQAITATFNRRGTKIPKEIPVALSDECANDRNKNIQWNAFLKRNGLENTTVGFSQVVRELRSFLGQPLKAASYNEDFPMYWSKRGGWEKP